MKRLTTAIAAGVLIAGVTATSASAAEYQVEKGDTLWGIAQEHGTSVEQLQEINNLNNTIIYPAQTLTINQQTSSNSSSGVYQVESGDTLYGIGQANNVSIQEIMAWNNLSSSIIVPGQELSLNGESISQEATAPAEEKEQSSEEADEAAAAESTASETETTSNNADTTANKTAEKSQQNNDSPEGKTITVSATAYTANCAGCSGITATGVNLNANPNANVIAVDPDVIPLGTKVYVEGYGYATAADTGGAVQGKSIDVHVPTKSKAYQWGERTVDVTIVEK